MTRFLPAAVLAALFTLPFGSPAQAQSFPERPVRLIIPSTTGGNFDAIGRMLGQHLSEIWGKPVVIDNRPGANGGLGTALAAKAAPDGYTLCLTSSSTLAINPFLYKSVPFDTLKDLTPITIVTINPMMLVVKANSSFKTAGDLIEFARANPGKLNIASGGNGSLSHMSAEMIKARTGSNIVIVPYTSTSLALNGVLGGDVHALFDTISTSIPLVEGGQLRALAVTGGKRVSLKPDLPTISEVGIKDFTAEAKSGLVGPAGMPREIVEQIRRDVVKVLDKPEVRQRLRTLAIEPLGITPDEFAADLRAELRKWSEIVRMSGAKIE